MEDFLTSFQHPKRRVRQAAIRAQFTLQSPASIPHLLQIVLYDDDFLKRDAAEALGRIGELAVPFLLRALESNSKVVRRYATEGLRRTKSHLAVPKLIEVALSERHADYQIVALNAIEILGLIGDVRAVPVLIEMLFDSSLPISRKAVNALGSIKGKSALPALFQVLHNPANPSYLRQRAAWAIGEMQEPKIALDLAKFLHDNDASVRQSVALALGHTGNRNVVKNLLKVVMQDTDEMARRYAIVALGELRDTRAVAPLIKYFKTGKEKAPASIGHALFNIATPKALAAAETIFIQEATRKDLTHSRMEHAILRLGQLNSPKVITMLTELLNDKTPVRFPSQRSKSELAAEALRKIGTPEALSVLTTWQRNRL